MQCNHCQATIPDTAKFCPFCGTPVVATAAPPPASASVPSKPPPTLPISSSPPIIKQKKNRNVLFIVLPLVVLAIGAAVYFFFFFGNGDNNREETSEADSVISYNQDEDIDEDSPIPVLRTATIKLLDYTTDMQSDPTVWQDLFIHITQQIERQDSVIFRFAATQGQEYYNMYLLGQFEAELRQVKDGGATKWQIAGDPKWAEPTVVLEPSEHVLSNVYDPWSLTDGDFLTVALLPREGVEDIPLRFIPRGDDPFNFNGLEIVSKVHDTQENFDAFAQPIWIEVRISYLGSIGVGDMYETPIDVVKFQEYPAAIIFDSAYENVLEVSINIVSATAQDYIAIAEITIF